LRITAAKFAGIASIGMNAWVCHLFFEIGILVYQFDCGSETFTHLGLLSKSFKVFKLENKKTAPNLKLEYAVF